MMKKKIFPAVCLTAGLTVVFLGVFIIYPIANILGGIISAAGAAAAVYGMMRLIPRKEKTIADIDALSDPKEQLRLLNELYHSGKLPVREYHEKKSEIMSKL